jgi:hypothetical protein
MSWPLVLVATLTVAPLPAQSSLALRAERSSASSASVMPSPTVDQQDRVVHPIYVPPERDPGTPAGHGTLEVRSYRAVHYRHLYSVTFSPGLPKDPPTVIRALTMLCQVVAKFDVRGVVPQTTSPPRDDIWVFETRKGICIGTVLRSTDPHSTVVSVQQIDGASH